MEIILLIIITYFGFDIYSFNKCEYKDESGHNYLKVRFDLGLYGEYLTFKKLSRVNGYKRILVNTYIPKSNGETTELDVIMIHEAGIFVIESKNYSGWIFGDEKNQYWTQSLKGGQKNKFFNPVLQNQSHIRHLSEFLQNHDVKNYFSVIVFSNRCELKKVKLNPEIAKVLKRPNLNNYVTKKIRFAGSELTREKVNEIYEHLKPYSNVSSKIKMEHINRIKKR